MTMMLPSAVLALALLAPTLHASAETATGPSGLKVVARIAGPDGSWDYTSFDPARHRIYVAHGDAVLAIDADTGKANPAFAAGSHLHAVVPVPGTDLIVTTNSGDNTARVLSAVDGKLIASVPAAKDTDGAVWDPSTSTVLAIGGDSGEVTLVDPKAGKAAGSILIGGSLEFGAVDGKGKLWINLEDKNAVGMVDIAAKKLIATWPMAGCERPTGLALVGGDRLISVCGNGVAKILSAADGKEIASLKIGGFPDAVIYDAGRQLAYVPSALTGALAVIALSGPANNTIIDTVPTQIGARTGATDPNSGKIWLPTAQYILPVPAGQRPTTKPGTFEVLVLAR